MDAMEELSERCGQSCWEWNDLNTRQEKKIKERQPWSWIWRTPLSGQSPSGMAWTTHFHFPKKILRVLWWYFVQCGGAAPDQTRGVEELLASTHCFTQRTE